MTRVLAKHPYRDIQSPWWKACVGPQEQETARLSAPSQPNPDCYKQVPPSQRSKPCLPYYESGSSLSKPTRAEASTIFLSSNSSRNAGVYRPCPTNYFIKTLFCQAQVPGQETARLSTPGESNPGCFITKYHNFRRPHPPCWDFDGSSRKLTGELLREYFLCMGYSSL